jgi:hypothetical protein
VPVLTSLLAARNAPSGRRPGSPSVFRRWASFRGSPRSLPALRSRSLTAQARHRPPFAPGAPPHEVPGFGAVVIARPARVTDRGASLLADLRSVPRAGRRRRDSCRPRTSCLRPSGGSLSTYSVVCSIVKRPTPQSVPIRSILRDRGSCSVRIRSLLSSSPCLGEWDPPYGTRGSCRGRAGGRRNWVGTRRAPIGGLRRRGGVSRCHTSTATPCPVGGQIPNRVHHPYKGARRLQTVTPCAGRIRGAFGECRSGG